MIVGSNLSWLGIKKKEVYTKGAGLLCKCTGQCTLEGSVQSGGGYWGCKIFVIGY